MKCLYYLTPTLDSSHHISDDLHEAGIDDWVFHILWKDEAWLKNKKLHFSNYIETLDIIRDGVIGANLGFIIGAMVAAAFMYFEPFGPDRPIYIYFIFAAFVTLFCAWVGGLTGIGTENAKLRRFHADMKSCK